MEFRILDKTGDTKSIFDKDVPVEVEAAKEQFKSLLAKGFKAFTVGKDGKADKSVKKFKASDERYIFVPALAGG